MIAIPAALIVSAPLGLAGMLIAGWVPPFPGEPLPDIVPWLGHVNPILVVVSVAAIYLAVVNLRGYWRHYLAFLTLCYLISFFVFSTGRQVLKTARAQPLGDRPECLLYSTWHAAIWIEGRLERVRQCAPPGARVVPIAPYWDVDGGSDGKLEGFIDGPASDYGPVRWQAHVILDAPTKSWKAYTSNLQSRRIVFLRLGEQAALAIDACPDLEAEFVGHEKLYRQMLDDTTGRTFTETIAEHIDRDALPAMFHGAVELRKTVRPGVYEFANADGVTVGYLLPAAGEQGACALLDGPWVEADPVAHPGVYSFDEKELSGPLRDLMGQIALTISVTNLEALPGGEIPPSPRDPTGGNSTETETDDA